MYKVVFTYPRIETAHEKKYKIIKNKKEMRRATVARLFLLRNHVARILETVCSLGAISRPR